MLIWFDKYFNSHSSILSHISYRAILSLLTSFFVSLFLGSILIKYFKKLQKYQVIRKNGPKTHFSKKIYRLWVEYLSYSLYFFQRCFSVIYPIFIFGMLSLF